ncbi:MAG: recombinase family protein, partial [Chloroflexi bacterium]|nr:recombinase family protein [Chloroflexota bacterium]
MTTDQPLPPGSNILIYVRVSPRDGTEDGELSIDSQILELQRVADRWGCNVKGVYSDRLISGRTDAREAFQEMVARCQRRGADIDGVLVWRFSRFARNPDDSPYYKALLRRAGVKVISYKEPLPDVGGWESL